MGNPQVGGSGHGVDGVDHEHVAGGGVGDVVGDAAQHPAGSPHSPVADHDQVGVDRIGDREDGGGRVGGHGVGGEGHVAGQLAGQGGEEAADAVAAGHPQIGKG